MKLDKNFIILLGLLFVTSHVNCVINIAWMAVEPFTYLFNASTSLGALGYVIDEIENDGALLPGETFNVQWKDSGCNSKAAIGGMFDFISNRLAFNFDFFLGPICSGAMAPVAALASYLDIPVFGWISSDPPLADKTLYSTLVRFLWSINNIGEGIAILCREAGWNRVAIISTKGGDYGVLAEGVRDVLLQSTEDNFVVQRWVSGIVENPSQTAIEDAYTLVKDEARIIIVVVPFGELRNWTKGAFDSGMTDGEYVFIYTNQQTPDEAMFNLITSKAFWQVGDSWDNDVQKAYENFILVFARTLAFSTTNTLLSDFHTAAQNWVNPPVPAAEPDFYSLFLYDAMKVYARFATQEGTTRDGSQLFQAASKSITTGGATGDIILSDTCDRIPDYRFFDMNNNDVFGVAAETVTTIVGTTITRNINVLSPIIWGDGTTGFDNAPPDIPECGFDGALCESLAVYWAPPVAIVIVIILICVIYFVYKKRKYEHDLNSLIWKLNYEDMNMYMGGKAPGSQLNLRTRSQHMLKSRASVADSLAGQQLFITVANYKGTIVAIRKIRKPQGIKLDRELLQEMKRMIEMKHNNLNAFIGACIDPTKEVCCVWEYCTKGSLQDVIYNDSLSLDDMFKFSISIDILKGLEYLHETSLKVHGQLKSSNIVIDNRWMCKLTDFGMIKFSDGQEADPEQSDYAKYAQLLWTSPETLREVAGDTNDADSIGDTCRCHSNLGDVYSAGIIMKETFYRNSPYHEFEDDMEPKDMVHKVMNYSDGNLFRPDLTELPKKIEAKDVSEKLEQFIRHCWAEEPKDRLTASQAVKALTKINPFKKANVVDNMMTMMEKYSNQLEEIVGERTLELQEEQKKTEDLLFKMLPKSVAQDLKHGKNVEAESFDGVTIYFSDLPGFSLLAADCTPLQVVDILNGVYSLMDETINNHDVYKVETVGDVYVLASGLPLKNGDRHIIEVVNCAMDMISAMLSFTVPHKPSYKLPVRIGINSGPIVTGVVGLTNPRYCLFGDTMNTASRMESNGKPFRIHMSPASVKALGKFSGYSVADRGEIPVKGKGMMKTYWLVGKEGYERKLPDYRSELMHDEPKPQFLPPTTGKVTTLKVQRPSTESGFSEMNIDSRKNSNVSNGLAPTTTSTQRRTGTTEAPLIEIDQPVSAYPSNDGMPTVDVTSPR